MDNDETDQTECESCLNLGSPEVGLNILSGGRLFCLIFGMIGIPLMLTVLANVGSLMAEGLEYSWTSNRERIKRLARSLREGAISICISIV